MIKEINKLIAGYEPLPEVTASEFEQNAALAQVYAVKGFREYLIRSIKATTQATIAVENMEGLHFNRGRILVLRELLDICKRKFEEAEKIGLKHNN